MRIFSFSGPLPENQKSLAGISQTLIRKRKELRHGNVHNRPLRRLKTHSQPVEKDRPFPQVCKQVSHNSDMKAGYTYSHSAYCYD